MYVMDLLVDLFRQFGFRISWQSKQIVMHSNHIKPKTAITDLEMESKFCSDENERNISAGNMVVVLMIQL